MLLDVAGPGWTWLDLAGLVSHGWTWLAIHCWPHLGMAEYDWAWLDTGHGWP